MCEALESYTKKSTFEFVVCTAFFIFVLCTDILYYLFYE